MFYKASQDESAHPWVHPVTRVHIDCTGVVSYQDNPQLAVVTNRDLPVDP